MREAALHLAFHGLGAQRAESSAFPDNHGSAGVSRSLGYTENGVEWGLRRGVPATMTRFVLTAGRWKETPRAACSIEALEPCLSRLGLSEE
jgi:RimJ/RimL family protein N-acetyltransferase